MRGKLDRWPQQVPPRPMAHGPWPLYYGMYTVPWERGRALHVTMPLVPQVPQEQRTRHGVSSRRIHPTSHALAQMAVPPDLTSPRSSGRMPAPLRERHRKRWCQGLTSQTHSGCGVQGYYPRWLKRLRCRQPFHVKQPHSACALQRARRDLCLNVLCRPCHPLPARSHDRILLPRMTHPMSN